MHLAYQRSHSIRKFGNRLCLAMLGMLACWFVSPAMAQSAKEKKATPVSVDAVRSDSSGQTVPVIGRIVAIKAGEIAARTAGPVASMPIEIGEHVNKGDTLAVLVEDNAFWNLRLKQADVARAEAGLKTAIAQQTLRQQELARLENLRRSSAFSPARLEDATQESIKAESLVMEANAVLKRARAEQQLAEIKLADTKVRAPYSGVVSKRHTEVGAYVNVGQPVVSLLSDEEQEIEAAVPANRIGGLQAGTVVHFTLENIDQHHVAVVRAIVPEENPLTRTRTVRFTPEFDPHTNNVAANQSATLHIPSAARSSTPTVHKDAILTKGGNTVVYVVQDGKADLRPVRLGDAINERFFVIEGLTNGERVVVRGNERLSPGQAVVVSESR